MPLMSLPKPSFVIILLTEGGSEANTSTGMPCNCIEAKKSTTPPRSPMNFFPSRLKIRLWRFTHCFSSGSSSSSAPRAL
ncbi:hypothetical protein B0T14DRAFT_520629 [Immersiella caudata]|uniref:Uncharacterized protein n=1 Tax=Immersiella caudata TaxID=314043 RepID=A0AA40C0D6_9PEZI|nr:hypothetical protein B0T14DRAFT_520629 [Immersiella caudata]